MDEHRIGLKPIIGRVWAERGKAPTVPVQHRYQWLYRLCCLNRNASKLRGSGGLAMVSR